MHEKLTSLLLAVAEHGGTELELKYNDFFTATFRASAQVTGQVGTKAESGAESRAESKKITGQVTGQVAGQVAGQVGTRSRPSRDLVGIRQSHGQSHRGRKSFSCLKKSQSRQQKYRITDKWDPMLRQEGSHE
jgi:ATP-dependent DNA helicase RecG